MSLFKKESPVQLKQVRNVSDPQQNIYGQEDEQSIHGQFQTRYTAVLRTESGERNFDVHVRISNPTSSSSKQLNKPPSSYTHTFTISETIGNTRILPDDYPANISTCSRQPLEKVITENIIKYAEMYNTGREPIAKFNAIMRRGTIYPWPNDTFEIKERKKEKSTK